MIQQINPPLPVQTPRGNGLAHFLIDYGPEHHLMWVVFLDSNGECWTYTNPKIRAQKNITLGRLLKEDSDERCRSDRGGASDISEDLA